MPTPVNAQNITSAGLVKFDGTATFSGVTTTQFDVLVGAASNGISSIGPGSAGQVLQSGGAASNPAYSTATYPSTAGTAGKVLVSDGTNIVSSTPTFPNASASAGKFIISDGTNWIASTPTLPNTATGTGTILRADGTNWVATTATYPATTTSQQILYSTAANVVGQLTTANSALAATNSSGTLAMRAFSVVRQVFTSTGTYTPTSGMIYCDIECIGGGGAGGGAAATGASTVSVGAGGGGGEYARGTFSAATIGASKSVTIGAAGTANSGATGGNGGNTSVGATTISANGGGGGVTGATAAISNADGGAGGTGGTGGDFRTPGQSGFYGIADANAFNITAGPGGNTQYGAGGSVPITGSANQGTAGTGYGSGGAGSSNYLSQGAALSGGAGVKGVVIITEFVIA